MSTPEPRDLTDEDRQHIRDLHARFKLALSLEQVEASYRMSVALPDVNGRVPSSREQLGAAKMFADLLIARPKPEAPDREQGPVTFVVRDPFCTCPPCSCGAAGRKD